MHAYLDRDHSVLLVSSAADRLEKYSKQPLPLRVKEPLLRIRALTLGEQISDDINTFEGEELVVLHLMPDFSSSQLVEYSDKIETYLSETHTNLEWQSVSLEGTMVAQMNRVRVLDILEKTNLIFKVHLMPRGIVESARSRGGHYRSRPILSSIKPSTISPPSIPIV